MIAIVKKHLKAGASELPEAMELPEPTAGFDSRMVIPWHGGFLLLVGALGLFKMVNSDIWWHLRTGQLILEQGRIPSTDWYTYTNPDAPWIDLHWFFQVIAWLTYSAAGSSGLVVIKCLVGMAAFFALLSVRKKNWKPAVGVLCWIIPAIIFSGRFLVRPEVLSIALLAATLFVLHSAERRPRLLWFLPLIQLVWVNTQSLFVLQWVVLVCYSVDALIRTFREKRRIIPVSWRHWGGILGATAISTICNPYGLRGALFPITVFAKIRGPDREFYHAFAAELRGPLDLVADYGLPRVIMQPTSILLMSLFIAAAMVTAIRWKRGDLEIFRTLLLLGFAYLAINMTRNSALFAVIGGYVLRWNLGVLSDGVNPNRMHAIRRLISPATAAILVGGMTIILTGHYHSKMRVVPPREFGIGESDWYPHEAARHLTDAGMPDTFYAQHLGVAAICIKHATPPKRVFVDARLETNTRQVLARYQKINEELGMSLHSSLKLLTGGEDPLQWPAIIIANSELIARPGMLELLTGHDDWICVYSRPPPGLNVGDPGPRFVGGASIFVARERQVKEALPRADPLWLFVVMGNRNRGY